MNTPDNNRKEEILRKWKDSGLLDGITGFCNDSKFKLFESNPTQKICELPVAKRLLNNLPKDQDII